VRGVAASLAIAALAACAAPAAPAPIGNTAPPPAPAPAPLPAAAPIPREEIARAGVPPAAEVAAALVGRWDGRRYGYDSERGFAGEPGDSPRIVRVFGPDGRYREIVDGCERSGRYRVALERTDQVLYLARERDCHGQGPYEYPSYIHRLDADLLVLVDGVTAGVSAYRRVAR
jgi:hypothetical protein